VAQDADAITERELYRRWHQNTLVDVTIRRPGGGLVRLGDLGRDGFRALGAELEASADTQVRATGRLLMRLANDERLRSWFDGPAPPSAGVR
jgi:hypothetical protein